MTVDAHVLPANRGGVGGYNWSRNVCHTLRPQYLEKGSLEVPCVLQGS